MAAVIRKINAGDHEDTGETPKRPKLMPNRDDYTKAHKVIRYDQNGPISETFQSRIKINDQQT